MVMNDICHKSTLAAASLALLVGATEARADRCSSLTQAFGQQLADVTCFESSDLTTANMATTPANNSLPGLPLLAFTPENDRATIAPDPANRTPISGPVPGIQLNARIASDPTGQARLLLRLPDNWNGRLVVAGASGTRSEFNGDFAWSDYVVQKGYAYASQNKGVLNLKFSDPTDPLACRLNPKTYVHFYDNDPGQEFSRWREFMVLAAQLANRGSQKHYGKKPRYTYAVGTSNGGYQVRRAVETAPEWFDGGVDWEGTFVDADSPNLLTDLPAAVLNYPDYIADGRDATGTAAKNMYAAGFPPDLSVGSGSSLVSLWALNSASFWEVTLCQWQKRLDPGYETYTAGLENYNYAARRSASDVDDNLGDFATSGHIQRPLITVAGTMDALLPIDHHARAYARKVAASRDARDEGHRGERHEREPAYRLYEVQNGNHIETYKLSLPQLELIQPHAQHAFDLLVAHVEKGTSLPPAQCIRRGEAIAVAPAQPGHCATLLAP